jgi:alkanesulfonate monooxygenase SsuD/methylene tetrahydromethanopterin reductase-like flavin-dependent oxidoreductase (luciferase family)
LPVVDPQFGLYLPQLRMDYATIEARARAAEDADFHSVWLMDHLAPPMAPEHDSFEGWTLACFLAARTTRIRLGHLVLCNPFRPPALLAKMAATLDVLSGGRLDLGLGWGSMPGELATYGFGSEPAATRSAALAETLEVLPLLFTGEPVTYKGEHVVLDGAVCRPVPVQQPLPIHLGGGGERLTMPLVAQHAQWWNCPAYAMDRLADLRPLAGSARVSLQRVVGLAPSAAQRDETRALTERRFGSWGDVVAGTPDEVAAALTRDAAAGIELFIVQFADFGTPATIDLFAREVVPAVRAAQVVAGGDG